MGDHSSGSSAAAVMLLTFSASAFTFLVPQCTVKFTDNVSQKTTCGGGKAAGTKMSQVKKVVKLRMENPLKNSCRTLC